MQSPLSGQPLALESRLSVELEDFVIWLSGWETAPALTVLEGSERLSHTSGQPLLLESTLVRPVVVIC
jgi:hypothetical protein